MCGWSYDETGEFEGMPSLTKALEKRIQGRLRYRRTARPRMDREMCERGLPGGRLLLEQWRRAHA